MKHHYIPGYMQRTNGSNINVFQVTLSFETRACAL